MAKIFQHCKRCFDKPVDEVFDLGEERYCEVKQTELEDAKDAGLH